MHQKTYQTWKFYKQINQLPTKSHDELEDNSIVLQSMEVLFLTKLTPNLRSNTMIGLVSLNGMDQQPT